MSASTPTLESASALQVGALLPDRGIDSTAQASLGPAARSIIVVWATCFLLALSYPQALVSWLDDFEPNPVVDAAQSCIARLVTISESLGIARISSTVRDLGRRITHRPE